MTTSPLRYLVLIVALFAIGCSSQSTSNPAEIGDGLTVLAASENSLSLAYKNFDTVIFIEALRGTKSPDMYQKDPDAPKWEVDARFMAQNGRLFYTARGGDKWIDSSWLKDLQRQEDKYTSRDSNEALFIMASEMTKVLDAEVKAQVGAELAAKMEPLLTPIRNFGATAHESWLMQKARLHQHLLDTGIVSEDELADTQIGEVVYGSGGTGCDAWVTLNANYYYIAIHDKSTVVIARHSATRLYEWAGYWSHIHDNCNHGTCASDMSQKCLLQYYDAIEDYKPTWELQTCGTDYSTFSDPGHNCHDDTRVQLANFVYGNGHNKGPGSYFWCSGDDDTDISSWPGDQSGSPECDSSGDDGYTHFNMCRKRGLTGYNSYGGCYCDAACVNYNDCCIDGPNI